MDVIISFDSKQVTKKLNAMLAGFSDFTKPLNKIGDDMLQFYGFEVFDTQGAAIGEKWKPLAESTVIARTRRYGYYKLTPVAKDKILIWTGRMQRGFQKEVKPAQLRIFNSDKKFAYHQKGGAVPQRRMLRLTSGTIVKVMDRLNEYAEQVVNKT